MSQDQTEAVVLRGVDFSETSRIVTFLCPDRGRLACIAKGARRAKSPYRGMLDTFNRVELVYYWKDSRSVQPLGDLTVLDDFDGVKSDLAKSTYGAFVLELVQHIAHENEPSQPLYETVIRGLTGLDTWPGDVRTHCAWQVLGVLRAAGFGPTVQQCYRCGANVDRVQWFSFAGGAACGNCRGDVRLARADEDAYSSLASATEACPERVTVTRRLFDFIRRYAGYHVESDFRSARVIEQVYR